MMRRIAFPLLLLLATGASARDDASTIRDAAVSQKPFVLVAAPDEFFAKPSAVRDKQRWHAWRFELAVWAETEGERVNIVAVPASVFGTAVLAPEPGSDCTTLFVREDRQALVVREKCALLVNDYECGADWMRGRTEMMPAGAKVEAFVLRQP